MIFKKKNVLDTTNVLELILEEEKSLLTFLSVLELKMISIPGFYFSIWVPLPSTPPNSSNFFL
jgi:hypothetical protein